MGADIVTVALELKTDQLKGAIAELNKLAEAGKLGDANKLSGGVKSLALSFLPGAGLAGALMVAYDAFRQFTREFWTFSYHSAGQQWVRGCFLNGP